MKFKDGEDEWEIIVIERVVGDWYKLKEDGRVFKCSHVVFMQYMGKANELIA